MIELLGLNGSGKTTLLETALAFSEPCAASVKVFGQESAKLAERYINVRIGFVPQQGELLTNVSGKQYLELISLFYDTGPSLFYPSIQFHH